MTSLDHVARFGLGRRMYLEAAFERIAAKTPVTVMTRAALEHARAPADLDALFAEKAVTQYKRSWLFSSVVDLKGMVVAKVQPSLHAADQAVAHPRPVSLTSVYDKRNRLEPEVVAAMVRHNAARLRPVIDATSAGVGGKAAAAASHAGPGVEGVEGARRQRHRVPAGELAIFVGGVIPRGGAGHEHNEAGDGGGAGPGEIALPLQHRRTERTMNKVWSRLVGAGLAVAAMAGAFAGAPSEALAGDSCSPDFKVVNQTGDTIKVVAVKYRVANVGDFFTENLGNRNVDKGKSETWKSQKLGKAGIGESMQFKVEYEVGNYNRKVTGTLSPSSKCSNSQVYTLTVN